jgi:hypothetical protein
MKRMIKILGVITIMALLLGGATVTVAATEVAVSIDAPAQAAANSDFTAKVNISEVVNFDACNYDVSFDVSVLRLDSVTSGLIGSTTIPVDIYNQVSLGTWRVVQNVPGLSGVSGSGYLAVLHFHVIGSGGDSSISLSKGVLSDKAAKEITATWGGDSVRVGAASEATTPEAITPPPAANSTPEAITPPPAVTPPPEAPAPQTVVTPSPGATTPGNEAPLPAKPINWVVLREVIGGIVAVGIIIFLLVRKRAY